MLATKPQKRAKKPRSEIGGRRSEGIFRHKPNWKKAKEIKIPIAPSNGTFKRYDGKPQAIAIAASIKVTCCGDGQAWRIMLDTPLYGSDDPDCDKRRSAPNEQKAVLLACEELLRQLRTEMDIRIQHGQQAIASAEALAVNQIGAFRDHLKEHGSYLTEPIASAPSTALVPAKRADVPAVIDLDSKPAEKLSTEERRELKSNEQKIERGARAWLDLGTALQEIHIKRLYREGYATFEAYVAEKWHLERSTAYQLIEAKKRYELARPDAEKLKLEFTAESQLRALRGVDSASDMKATLQRAARMTTADADGIKRPTARILSEAVKRETTAPEDLKREAAEQKARAAHAAGQTKLTNVLIDRAEAEQRAAAESHPESATAPTLPRQSRFSSGPEIIGDLSAFREALGLPIAPDPEVWEGRKEPWAADLHQINRLVLSTARLHLGQAKEEIRFRDYLSELLLRLEAKVRSGNLDASASIAGDQKRKAR